VGIREENVDGYITRGARRKKETVKERWVVYCRGKRLKEEEIKKAR
jgi:hypothetical protein